MPKACIRTKPPPYTFLLAKSLSLCSTARLPCRDAARSGYAHWGPKLAIGVHMPLYETVLIARNEVTQQQVEAVADAIAVQVEAEGGSVKKREYWGLRGLAYRIKKNRKGHYMLLGLDAPPASINEMERQLGLNEDVLRFMTVRVEALEEAPSAVLSRKGDERERGFRGPKPAGRFESGRRKGYDDREEFRARDPNDDLLLGIEE